jgi:cytochrome c2
MGGIVRKVQLVLGVVGALAMIAVAGCTASPESAAGSGAAAAAVNADGLTGFQVEHGIGPVITPITLDGSIDKAMAKSGAQVFEQKCSACHRMDERYVGPALGEVTKRRSPSFVMNMVLNPQGMIEKHPVTKKLLAEYLVAMPNQNLTQDDARQVLEYLRTQTSSDNRSH